MKTILNVLNILLATIACASCANLIHSVKDEIKNFSVEPGDCSTSHCWNDGVCRTNGSDNFCDCKIPYAGKYCEKKDCSRNPCKNGGECRTHGGDISCECKPDFYGKYCAQECYCRNGYCEENWRGLYVCKCPAEYGIYTESLCAKCDCGEGANCTWKVTMNKDIKYCICKTGYSVIGLKCEADCSRRPCKNEGKCIPGNRRSYCDCKLPFFGGYCENHPNSCFSNPCKNNGTCENYDSNYKCSCENGYTGHDCETASDPCNPNPCKNYGICENIAGKHNCLCIYGYTGNECEIVPDPCNSKPCKNNGKCESHDVEYNCLCENGYTGHDCETVDYCAFNPCQNGGSCKNGKAKFECTCTEIYGGQNCSENLWCGKYGQDLCGKEKCQYNETMEAGYCVCENDKIFDEQSKTCMVDHCASQPCQNGGSCKNGKHSFDCTCTGNYRGKDCSENIWCEKHGKNMCNNEKCQYDETTGSGYCVCENGKIFQETLKTCMEGVCHTHVCENGGICEEEDGVAKCFCRNPFGGERCEYERVCSPNYCKNGGICEDEGDYPICYCKFAYSGERCDRDYRYAITVILPIGFIATLCFCGGLCLFRKKRKLPFRDEAGCKTQPKIPL